MQDNMEYCIPYLISCHAASSSLMNTNGSSLYPSLHLLLYPVLMMKDSGNLLKSYHSLSHTHTDACTHMCARKYTHTLTPAHARYSYRGTSFCVSFNDSGRLAAEENNGLTSHLSCGHKHTAKHYLLALHLPRFAFHLLQLPSPPLPSPSPSSPPSCPRYSCQLLTVPLAPPLYLHQLSPSSLPYPP